MKRFCHIFFLFTAMCTYGQVLLEAGPDQREFRVNQPFTVTFRLELRGNDLVQETRLKMPDFSKFNVVGSGSDRVVVPLENDDRFIRQIAQFVLEPKSAGKMKIGSALVTVNGKIYKTEPFDIYVREAEIKTAAVPVRTNDLSLNLEIDDDAVYQYQPAVAVLRAYSSNYNNFRKLKGITLPSQKNANIVPVNMHRKEVEASESGSSQVMAVFIVYPTESGHLVLSPAKGKLGSKAQNLLSNRTRLNVKKLPPNAPAEFKDAVGDFDVSISHDSTAKAEVAKPVDVFVKIKGAGNFANMKLPELKKSEDYRSYPPKLTKDITVSEEGLKGEITAHYIVIPKKNGAIKIATTPFAFFNPEKRRYISLGEKEVSLDILTHEERQEARTTVERVNDYTNVVLETVNSPVLPTKKLRVVKNSSLNWPAFVLNSAILFSILALAWFIRNRFFKRKPAAKNTGTGSVADTEQLLKEKQTPDLAAHLAYLNRLATDRNSTGFFNAFEEMNADLNQHFTRTGEELKTAVEKRKGRQAAEDFIRLQNRVQMEKFSPVREDSVLEDLMKDIEKVYSGFII